MGGLRAGQIPSMTTLITARIGLGAAAALMLAAGTALADGAPLDQETGIRAGSGAHFDNFELYYRRAAPWIEAQLVDPWLPEGVQARWDVTLGYWDGHGGGNAFAALGPVLEFGWSTDWRLSLGVQPTLISEHDGNGRDLGGPLQFTSHLAVTWAPPGALVVGLRIQHTSNSRLYDSNPGVDIVAAEVGYGF